MLNLYAPALPYTPGRGVRGAPSSELSEPLFTWKPGVPTLGPESGGLTPSPATAGRVIARARLAGGGAGILQPPEVAPLVPYLGETSSRGFKGEEVPRGEATGPRSGNSALSPSDLAAQPSAESPKEHGWATEQEPAQGQHSFSRVLGPSSRPEGAWPLRWPGGACCATTPQEGERNREKCTSTRLGSVVQMAPPRGRLDPRHIRIRKVATFKGQEQKKEQGPSPDRLNHVRTPRRSPNPGWSKEGTGARGRLNFI